MFTKQLITNKVLRHLGKFALCAIAGIALFASCQDMNSASDASSGTLSAARYSVNPNAITITTQAQLEAINSDPSNDYILGNDLTVTEYLPVCDPDDADPFTGTFDGGTYTLTMGDILFPIASSSILYFLKIKEKK
jgi:hypothetical protein